jgi:hypothetical protein
VGGVSCEACDQSNDLVHAGYMPVSAYFVRIGNGNVRIVGCAEHVAITVDRLRAWRDLGQPVHRCPAPGESIMPCCGRTPFEVPGWHRMTVDGEVTCKARTS